MEYGVKIVETLVKELYVEASSPEEAQKKAEAMWRDGDIVLGADDFCECDIRINH